MKRKKPVVSPTVQKEPGSAAALGPKSPVLDIVWVCLFSILLFLGMTIQTGRMTVILLAAAFALSIGKGPLRNLRRGLSVPLVGLLAFGFMQGFAAIYSHFGSYAIGEYQKFLAAFALAAIVVARFEKKHVKGLLWGFAVICAAISLVCIDAASFTGLFQIFNSLAEALGATFADVGQDVWGTRVAGIYNDANVSASILALGTLAALYLANTGRAWREKFLACFLLGISAMGFFLSMSRGAILCFVLALAVYLLAAGKGNRLPLFFLMFFSAVVVIALSIPAISGIIAGNILPDILTLLSGVAIFLLQWGLGERAAALLSHHLKTAALVVAILLVAAVGYAVAAMTATGPYTFDETGFLVRTIDLEPGAYTLSGDWDGEIQVNILLQNEMDVVHSTGTALYNGPIADAAFTVPEEDGGRLSIQFRSDSGSVLRQVVVSDGTEVSLGHPLLPAFAANRLQDDLFSSASFILRIQYLKDGWALFVKSPLIGHGLGSAEGLLTSVQPYYYESKYLHNQLLQVMEEMGLLGLVSFLALLGGAAWLILRRLRKGGDPLAAVLLGSLVMMTLHSLMEINFSVRAYQEAAYFLLMLPIILYAEPAAQDAAAPSKRIKWGGVAAACCFWVYFAVFGGLYESHRMVVRETDGFSATNVQEFMDGVESFISRDVFDHEDLQLTYVANAAPMNDSRFNGSLQKYVKELRASGTYPACSGLARYYYLPRGEFEELFACSREGIAQEASAKNAWNLQFDFYRNEVLPAMDAEQIEVFLKGVLETKAYLDAYSQDRLEEIALTAENQAFLEAVASVRDEDIPVDEAYAYLLSFTEGAEPEEAAQ